VPASRRGAFMSLSGCARDLAMGVTSSIGGWIVTKAPSGQMENFHWLGWMAAGAGLLSVWLASRVRVNDTVATVPSSSSDTIPMSALSINSQLSTEN